MRHFSFLLFVLVQSFVFSESTNIVYTKSDGTIAKVSGQMGFLPGKGKIRAFLLELKSPLGFTLTSMVPPKYQVDVKRRKFEFPFVEPGEYILGVYRDTNRNGLLELGKEIYRLASPCPINTKEQSKIHVKIEGEDESPLRVHLKNIPGNATPLAQFHTIDEKPLYLRQAKGSHLTFDFVSYPVKLAFVFDRNDNRMIDQFEKPTVFYEILSPPEDEVVIDWGTPWKPLKLLFPGGVKVEKRVLRNLDTDEDRSIGMVEEISFRDFPTGLYQVIHSVDGIEIASPKFQHNDQSRFNLPLDPRYIARLTPSEGCERVQVFKDMEPVFAVKAQRVIKLYQPGNYMLSCFKELDTNGVFDLNSFKNQFVHLSMASISESSPSTSVNFTRIPEYQIKGDYYPHQKNDSDAKLVFFQETSQPGFFNTLAVFPLNPKIEAKIPFVLNLNPARTLFVAPDFDGNYEVDEAEREFIRGFNPQNLAPEGNRIDFPMIRRGVCRMLYPRGGKGKYFLEIISPATEEVLASDFIGYQGTDFGNLPIGMDLRLKLVHDKNGNSAMDSGDKVYKLKPVRIPVEEGQMVHSPSLPPESEATTL